MDYQEFRVTSSCGEYTRRVWLSEGGPSGVAQRLCLLLDGEFIMEQMDVLPEIERLVEDPSVPAMRYLFVSYVDPETRHKDYICNPRYARFIAEDVVAWARRQVPTLEAKEHLLCGVSLSGLCAAYTTLQHPEVFSFVLSQSGSFWWEHEAFAEMARGCAPVEGRFWLSVGDQETDENVAHTPALFQEISQIAGVTKAASVLEGVGAQVHVNQYAGGHEPGPWKEEFTDALRWLLSAEDTKG